MKICIVAALVAASTTALADPIDRIVSEVSRARIEANIRKLVSFGTRNSLSDPDHPSRGVGAARRWILEEMRRCGGERLEVSFDARALRRPRES